MRKVLLFSIVTAALVLPSAGSAGELKVSLAGGRATIIADDVPVRAILQEWARVGQSRILNAEKLVGPPVTLRLINVPEQEALDVLLRSASGYVAAPRAQMIANASQYDRIVILATSRPAPTAAGTATAPVAAPPQTAPYPQNPMAQQPPMEPDDDEPEEPNPATARPPITAPQPGPLQVSPQPGAQPVPGQPLTPGTAPRPGMVAPQPGVLQPQPGAPTQPPVKPGGGGE